MDTPSAQETQVAAQTDNLTPDQKLRLFLQEQKLLEKPAHELLQIFIQAANVNITIPPLKVRTISDNGIIVEPSSQLIANYQ